MLKAKMRLVYNRAPIVSERVRQRVGVIVRTFAFRLEAEAKLRAPVQTGFLRNSIRAEKMPVPMTYRVEVGAEYAPFVEFGTHRASARPFFGPAIEAIRADFIGAIERAVQEAAR